MRQSIFKSNPQHEEWLDTLARCMRLFGVQQFDDCEIGYMYARYIEGATPYTVAAALWGPLEGKRNGQ